MELLGALGLGLVVLGGPNGQTERKPPPPFADEISRFRAEDRKNPPAPNQILFIGSSSFTRWTDVGDYFPTYHILNRAFGGSTLLDQIRFVDAVVFPYRPKQVVVYCGENDFAAEPKLPADEVVGRFEKLFRLIRGRLPQEPIVYVSMKPSPSRWALKDKFKLANRKIAAFCRNQSRIQFVDVWAPMLNERRKPKPEIFGPDRLHMNAEGYRIWQPLLERVFLP